MTTFQWGNPVNGVTTTVLNAAITADNVVDAASYVAKNVQVLDEADYASLATALAASTAGQTVVVHRSISTGAVVIPVGVTLRAMGAVTVTLTGNITLSDSSTLTGFTFNVPAGSHGVAFGTSVGATVADCMITGNSVSTGYSTGAASHPTLVNCSSASCYYSVLLNSGVTDALVVGGVHTGAQAPQGYEASFYVPNALRSKIIGVTVSGSATNGFYDAGMDNSFANCVAIGNGTVGTDSRGAYSDGSTRSTWTDCRFNGNVEAGFYERNTSVRTTLTSCTAAGNNTDFRPGGHGFELLGTLFSVTGCTASGGLGNANGEGNGFYLGGSGVSAGCISDSNWSYGFYIYDASHVTVSGWIARNNGQSGTNVFDGIAINGSGAGSCSDITVSGGHAYDTQGTKTQRYGISVAANANNYCIVGNTVRTADNLVAGLIDTGGLNKIVANNLIV